MFQHKNRSAYIMSDDVLEAYIEKYISVQPEGVKEINFVWQGGEPALLPRLFLEKILKYQHKYHRAGMRVSNVLQSNATLITGDLADWLAKNHFLVGVSIDGDEELHNLYRRDRNGKGTFSRVMRGIENLKSAGAEFNTLTVVQHHNGAYPERLYSFLTGIGANFLQFIPLVEQTGNKTPCSLNVDAEQWGRFLIGVFDCWVRGRDIGKVFVQHFDMLLGIYCGYPASLCVHSEICGDAAVIEHNGDLYSCDHFVTKDNFLGNILTDDLQACINGKQQTIFGNVKKNSLPRQCLYCSWLQLCHGGCPKDRIVAAENGMLNYLCDGYKTFFAHADPFFKAMTVCLQRKIPPAEFRQFFIVTEKVGRNAPCPCQSGLKHKLCHGK
ncbi:uncharacterized protein SAMN05660330_04200 [Desulforhopalus singaporensis]|uniref:Anaerobic sulfatase maturase n=2 Tax=Desulforhopalus singaporensis TaxID=91360 RepID=A0A1H0VS74_9BACT|nr:uncharacterized protein SAMN05660330_04200 [Desulforhopalus singaporensis]